MKSDARTGLKNLIEPEGIQGMVTSRDDVLRLIEQNQATLRRLGVRRLGLFGSYARGEAIPGSDLDFVVELSENSFDAYMDAKMFLEELFRSRVDLVTMSSIKPRLLPIIQQEAIYASGF
jgi:predicted nucleotidyltransferase